MQKPDDETWIFLDILFLRLFTLCQVEEKLRVIPVLTHKTKRRVTSWICSWKRKCPIYQFHMYIQPSLCKSRKTCPPPAKKKKIEREVPEVCACAIPTISVFQILSSKFPNWSWKNQPPEVVNSSITFVLQLGNSLVWRPPSGCQTTVVDGEVFLGGSKLAVVHRCHKDLFMP